jgi:hypothetical protein
MSESVVERAATSRVIATIPTGATGLTSKAIDLRGYRSGHVLIPTTWAGADLAFKSSDTDVPEAALRKTTGPDITAGTQATFLFVRRDASSAPLLRVTNIPTSGGGWMPLPAALFYGHEFVKAMSVNTGSEAAVDQTGSPTLVFRFSA